MEIVEEKYSSVNNTEDIYIVQSNDEPIESPEPDADEEPVVIPERRRESPDEVLPFSIPGDQGPSDDQSETGS